ncbi:MAG: universal stress protein [Desulfobacterales bacterium]
MNQKINKILACVDFSEYSPMVMEYAVMLSRGLNAQILMLNIINQIEIDGAEKAFRYYQGTLADEMKVENYVNSLKNERYDKLNQFIKESFPDAQSMIIIKIDVGIPFECILNTIETENVDLVVMANKGRSNIARILFGKAAEKVFRHSPVPVVSVRDRKRFKRN